MMGSRVVVLVKGRERAIVVYVPNFTPKQVNASWQRCLANQVKSFNLTGRHGEEVSFITSRVDILSAGHWESE